MTSFCMRTSAALMMMWATATVSAGTPQQPPIQSAIKPIELAVEATGSTVILPSGSVGTLVVTSCVGCAPQSFVAGSATRYFIGRTLVTIDALRSQLVARPQAHVGVFYDAKTRELMRVLVSGTVAPAKSGTTTAAPATVAPATGSPAGTPSVRKR